MYPPTFLQQRSIQCLEESLFSCCAPGNFIRYCSNTFDRQGGYAQRNKESNFPADLHGRSFCRAAAGHRENRFWLDRLEINCTTQQFRPPSKVPRAELSEFLANAGCVELVLGRVSEAQQALERSESLTPEDPSVHLALAQVYESQRQLVEAEQELRAVVSLRHGSETPWLKLADFYIRYQRFTEARPTLERAVQLAPFPESNMEVRD